MKFSRMVSIFAVISAVGLASSAFAQVQNGGGQGSQKGSQAKGAQSKGAQGAQQKGAQSKGAQSKGAQSKTGTTQSTGNAGSGY